MSDFVQNVGAKIDPQWDETNGWRQGSVLLREDAVSLGIVAADDESRFAIIITHDCDCVAAIKREPEIEVVVGSLLKKLDGNLTFAKSTRKLHIALSECGKLVELQISKSRKILKEYLANLHPDAGWPLNSDEKRVLAQWLAARYNRASFPTTLVNRLRRVEDAFKEHANRYAVQAIGIFVDFDPEYELSGSEKDETYTFNISVVFDDRLAGAEESCSTLCSELQAMFAAAYKDVDNTWTSIELGICEAIADTEFTYRDSRTKLLYRFDDLSLRADPQGELPS